MRLNDHRRKAKRCFAWEAMTHSPVETKKGRERCRGIW
jgi:hypothetical protein